MKNKMNKQTKIYMNKQTNESLYKCTVCIHIYIHIYIYICVCVYVIRTLLLRVCVKYSCSKTCSKPQTLTPPTLKPQDLMKLLA